MTAAIVINANDGVTRNVMTGGETEVDFDFPIYAATHIEIYETDTNGTITQLVKDTDFTVPAGSVNQQAGGTVDLDSGVYPSGATAGHVFTAYQAAPYSRVTDFNQAGDFFADTLNQELDLIAQQIQQVRRDLARCAILPVDTTLDGVDLPDPVDGYLLAWSGVSGTLTSVTVGSISATIDTTFTSLSSGDILTYNGSAWTNTTQLATNQIADDAVTPAKTKTTVTALGSIGGGTQDIDLSGGVRSFSGTVDTSTTTFTFSSPKATGNEDIFTMRLTNGGSQTVNWPASVDWVSGTAPSLTSSGVDELTFKTIDGGTTWVGSFLLDVQ
ncbi:MAG: hypothetical protein ACPGQQ_00840 [Candidatus Puniceispirillaceae bacterium]